MYSRSVQPTDEYRRRLADRESLVTQREATHLRLGHVRLVLALMAAVIAWESLKQHALSPWWMIPPLLAFIGVAAYHRRILRARNLARRAAAFYRCGLARIDDRWAGLGPTGERFIDPHHVYAADLDLF